MTQQTFVLVRWWAQAAEFWLLTGLFDPCRKLHRPGDSNPVYSLDAADRVCDWRDMGDDLARTRARLVCLKGMEKLSVVRESACSWNELP
jgi:hypothetical protein